ncbi:hypothetical protein L2E82_12252 [Cichorium intybus]|uniref:Uncharacterized protein n=1 Tax=Cichorium intybus TaxID=13427 RepID=A0ACB9GGK7_CICIN|nr:hypothetical protein L2E82_12252 [Cichorium intybus]
MAERIWRQMHEVAVNNYRAGVDGCICCLKKAESKLFTEEKKEKQKVDTKKKETLVVIDNEVLQEFRSIAENKNVLYNELGLQVNFSGSIL